MARYVDITAVGATCNVWSRKRRSCLVANLSVLNSGVRSHRYIMSLRTPQHRSPSGSTMPLTTDMLGGHRVDIASKNGDPLIYYGTCPNPHQWQLVAQGTFTYHEVQPCLEVQVTQTTVTLRLWTFGQAHRIDEEALSSPAANSNIRLAPCGSHDQASRPYLR